MFRLMTTLAAMMLASTAYAFGPRTNVNIVNANGASASAVSVQTRGGFFNRGTNVNVASVNGFGGAAFAGAGFNHVGVNRAFVGACAPRAAFFNNQTQFSYGFNHGARFDPFIGYNRGIRRGFYGASYGLGASYGGGYNLGASYGTSYGVDQSLAQSYFDPAPAAATKTTVIEETVQPPPVVTRRIVTEQVQQQQQVSYGASYGAQYYAAPVMRYGLGACGACGRR